MSPLRTIQHLLEEKHPGGKRLTGIQKCVRTDDIDEVGDDIHLNIDTGMGLERVLTIFNGKTNVYDTELFVPLMGKRGEIVKVYTIPGYSKEICGGPHA